MSYLLQKGSSFTKVSKLQNYPKINKFNTFYEADKTIAQCYQELDLPFNSSQDKIREAFLELAKRYHPDCGSPDASIDKFCDIEKAFRVLSKHNTGKSNKEEVKKIVFDIKHTAPQHRQYLSFEGIGHGTPFQRQKQYAQSRALKASTNVLEHRVAKAVASEKTVMKKQSFSKKHDIRTKYGFDRVVEDLIQESISKGEFNNLTGSGKPLRNQNNNPYVDFTTHKLNEVLINNGFTPEWITMKKDIEQEIEDFKEEIRKDRLRIGPYPLTSDEEKIWQNLCDENRNIAKSINMKINTFNLIVPLVNKQKFHIDFESISEDILKNGQCLKKGEENKVEKNDSVKEIGVKEDILSMFLSGFSDFISEFIRKDKKRHCEEQSVEK